MLSSGQSTGLASFRASTATQSRLPSRQRKQMVANAHGLVHSSTPGVGSATEFLSSRNFGLMVLHPDGATGFSAGGAGRGSVAIGDSQFQLGGGLLGPCRAAGRRLRRFLRHGTCQKEMEEDSMLAGLTTEMYEGGGSSAGTSEWTLVLALAVPLLVSKMADEVSMLGMEKLWGEMGTTALAAGNYCSTWQTLSLVVIYGGQSALYTMVPQASGAGNNKQVGTVLTMSMLWNCVIFLAPVLVFYWFITDFIPLPDSGGDGDGGGDSGYGYGGDSNCSTVTAAPEPEAHAAPEPEPVEGTSALSIEMQVSSYSRACALYLLPYVAMTTVMTWLECLEIVSTVAFIAAIWTVVKVPLAWFLMFPMDLGLEGYAHAYTLATLGQCLTMYVVIAKWKKQHLQPEQWWYGIGCSDALQKSLNWRFIKCTVPMAFQMLADSAGATVYYSLMAGYSERALAAYGVTDALTGTGGSFSLALWTAISIRVGTLLGENDPARARTASVVGMWYSLVLGVLLAGFLYALKQQLAEFLSPTDVAVQRMMVDANVIVPVCLFYLLSSVQYGLWGILQGQSRVCFVSFAITANTWGFAVPLSYGSLAMWGPDSASAATTRNSTELASGAAPGCSEADEVLPLQLMWWSITAAMVLCNLLMGGAILLSNWQQLADEAVEYAEAESDGAEEGGTESWVGSVVSGGGADRRSGVDKALAPMLESVCEDRP